MDADARLLSSLEHNCGPHIMEALRDPSVIEIMLNPDGAVWIERYGQEQECVAHLPLAQGKLILAPAMAICGVIFLFNREDISGGFKLLLSAVFGISFIAFAGSMVNTVFSFSGALVA